MSTIIVDYTPEFLAALNPDFFLNVVDNQPGCVTDVVSCFDQNQFLWPMLFGPSLLIDFPIGTQFVFAAGVPEPATAVLLACGILLAMWFNRRVA